MKKIILIIILLLVGCRAEKIEDSNNVRIEYKERLVTDTIEVKVPQIVYKDKVILTPNKDTFSLLENNYFKCEAGIKDNILYHNFESKITETKIPIQTIVKDSIIFKDRIKTNTVTQTKTDHKGYFIALILLLLIIINYLWKQLRK